MKTNIDKIQTLKSTAKTLNNLVPSYMEKIKDSSCDKYNLEFGGDNRFSVFSSKVFLDCHLGYYGNSSCSTFGYVHSDLAGDLLNKALNKHMRLILETMADFAEQEAAELVTDAQKEIDEMQSVIDSCTK